MTVTPETPEDPRVRFAAERTLLAWVRTGLALMGLGFVVARFGLFFREYIATPSAGQVVKPSGVSVMLGVGLTVLGVFITAMAGLEYRKVIRRIERGEPYRPSRFSLGLILATVLTAIGIAITGYLLIL